MALFNMPSTETIFKTLFLKKKGAPDELTFDTVMRGLTGFPHRGADRHTISYVMFLFEFALNTLKLLFIFLPFVGGKGLGMLAESIADADAKTLVQHMGFVGYILAGLSILGSGLTSLASLAAFGGAFLGTCLLASTDIIKASGEYFNKKVSIPVTVLAVITHTVLLVFSWPAFIGLFGLKVGARLNEELQKSAHSKHEAEKVYIQMNGHNLNVAFESPRGTEALMQQDMDYPDGTPDSPLTKNHNRLFPSASFTVPGAGGALDLMPQGALR